MTIARVLSRVRVRSTQPKGRESGSRRVLLGAVAVVGVLVALIGAAPAIANGVPLKKGDVLAAVGSSKVKNFSASGVLQDTLTDTGGTEYTTGMCFDSSGNLYVTDFKKTMSKYDSGANLLISPFGSGFAKDHPESCAVDAADHIYVGGPFATTIEKLDTSGNLLASFSVASPGGFSGGTDWVDLAANQCTVYYDGEGTTIKRYNVCTKTQEADFVTGLTGGFCTGMRIRRNGEVMVACSAKAYRLDPSGKILHTYPAPGSPNLFALTLDPDGTSFWTGDDAQPGGVIYHIDIATGKVINQFNSSPTPGLGGLAVVGEIVAGNPLPSHYYQNNVLNSSEPRTIVNWGTVALKTVVGGTGEVTCHTVQAGSIYNPVGGGAGLGSTEALIAYKCENTTCPYTSVVTAESLPWPSVLELTGGVVRAKATGVKVKVDCQKEGKVEKSETFVGANSPRFQNGTSALHPGFLEYDAGAGILEKEGSNGAVQARIEGEGKILGYDEQELISVKTP